MLEVDANYILRRLRRMFFCAAAAAGDGRAGAGGVPSRRSQHHRLRAARQDVAGTARLPARVDPPRPKILARSGPRPPNHRESAATVFRIRPKFGFKPRVSI